MKELRKNGSHDPNHQNVKVTALNPKSITMEELYGSFNDTTGEWSDGLVAILVREAVADQSLVFLTPLLFLDLPKSGSDGDLRV